MSANNNLTNNICNTLPSSIDTASIIDSSLHTQSIPTLSDHLITVQYSQLTDDAIDGLTTDDLDELNRLEAEALCSIPKIGVHNKHQLPRNMRHLEKSLYIIHAEDQVHIRNFNTIGNYLYPSDQGENITISIRDFINLMKDEERRRLRDPHNIEDHTFHGLISMHAQLTVRPRRRGPDSRGVDLFAPFQRCLLSYELWEKVYEFRHIVGGNILRERFIHSCFHRIFTQKYPLTPHPHSHELAERELFSILLFSFYKSLFPLAKFVGVEKLFYMQYVDQLLQLDLSCLCEEFFNELTNRHFNGVPTFEYLTIDFLRRINMFRLTVLLDVTYNIVFRQANHDSEDEECP